MQYVIQSTIDKEQYFKGVSSHGFKMLEYGSMSEAKIYPSAKEAEKDRNKYYVLSRQTKVVPMATN